jgi:hypothetical protein
LGVKYYIIHDPQDFLGNGVLRGFELRRKKYVAIDPSRLPKIELGLILWQGKFEDMEELWLRWCDMNGNLIPTGAELAAKEAERADEEAKRADKEAKRADKEAKLADKEAQNAARLAQRLKALGIDPDAE